MGRGVQGGESGEVEMERGVRGGESGEVEMERGMRGGESGEVEMERGVRGGESGEVEMERGNARRGEWRGGDGEGECEEGREGSNKPNCLEWGKEYRKSGHKHTHTHTHTHIPLNTQHLTHQVIGLKVQHTSTSLSQSELFSSTWRVRRTNRTTNSRSTGKGETNTSAEYPLSTLGNYSSD